MDIRKRARLLQLLAKIPFIGKKLTLRIEQRRLQRVATTVQQDLVNANILLKGIDEKLIKLGWTRQKRRQFWHDFIKYEGVRADVFNALVKDKSNVESVQEGTKDL